MTDQLPSKDVQAAITASHLQLIASFAERDGASIAAIYTEHGQLLPAYSAPITGQAAIRAFWEGCIDMGISMMQRMPLEVDCLTDTVNEVGEYLFRNRQGRVVDVGKYVVIWKQQQGQWKIHRDIWTSNLPMAQ